MSAAADIQPAPGLGIDVCAQAVQRAMARAERARVELAEAEGAVAAWKLLLGDALAEADGEAWVVGDIVTHRSTGPQPFVVWHFSGTLPNGLPPQLVLVCWPVKRDWTDKQHGDEHYFPANEVTKIGHRDEED